MYVYTSILLATKSEILNDERYEVVDRILLYSIIKLYITLPSFSGRRCTAGGCCAGRCSGRR